MPHPILRIDLASATPAYRQVVDQLRHLLVAGDLKPGQALPSVRQLATDLGIHHNTVAEAYRTLAFEGWLEVSRGKAVHVVERPSAKLAGPERKQVAGAFERRLRHLAAEMRARGLSAAAIAKLLRDLAGEVSQ